MRVVLALVLVSRAALCFAESDEPSVDALRFSGFGTIGGVHANAPPGWSFRRDIGQVRSSRSVRLDTDSRLGLQVNDQVTPQIEVVGQLLLARTSPEASLGDGVQWAFVAWRPSTAWALRVGRVDLDQNLMSDYRNVGFAYPTVRPPVDFYGMQADAFNGADLTRYWTVGDARWRVKGFAGRAHGGGFSRRGGYFATNTIQGLVVSREADGLLLRASVSRVRLDRPVDGGELLGSALRDFMSLPVPSVVDEASQLRQRLDGTRSPSHHVSISISQDIEEWQFTAEASRVFGPSITRYENGYFRVARRFGSVTAFSGLSRILGTYAQVPSPDWAGTLTPVLGAAAAQEVQTIGSIASRAINSAAANQHTLSVGARWDMDPQLALKLQWDRIDTSPGGGRLWVDAVAAGVRSNVVTAALDFVF